MYCGTTISAIPQQVRGELYTNENAESYIEYFKNGQLVREEVFPCSVRHLNDNHPASKDSVRL